MSKTKKIEKIYWAMKKNTSSTFNPILTEEDKIQDEKIRKAAIEIYESEIQYWWPNVFEWFNEMCRRFYFKFLMD